VQLPVVNSLSYLRDFVARSPMGATGLLDIASGETAVLVSIAFQLPFVAVDRTIDFDRKRKPHYKRKVTR
jgi:hypothetical protein